MNSSLTKNIAEWEIFNRQLSETREPGQEDQMLVQGVVKRISQIRLDRKRANVTDRIAWFDCIDKAAFIEDLEPSADQSKFLHSVSFRLRVMTESQEGPTARSLQLLRVTSPDAKIPSGVLFNVVGLGPEDTTDGTYKLFSGDLAQLVLPGSPEFKDTVTILDNFVG